MTKNTIPSASQNPELKRKPDRPLHVKNLVGPEVYNLIQIAKKMLKNEPVTTEEEALWKKSNILSDR